MTSKGLQLNQLLSEVSSRVSRHEAEILCAVALKSSREKLIAHSEIYLKDYQVNRCLGLISSREAGMPVAYLSKYREFYGLEFFVNRNVLIPRAETEFLVEIGLKFLKSHHGVGKVLELGTGCGAISVTLKKHFPFIKIVATDVSYQALKIAKYNVLRLLPASTLDCKRFFLLEGSWYDALRIPLSDNLNEVNAFFLSKDENQRRFDLIISNPPYIALDDPHLNQGDLRFEPLSALTDYKDGLSAIEHIVRYASDWLLPGGELWIEHGYMQKSSVVDIFRENNFVKIESIKDFSGIDRVTGGCLYK